MGGGFAVILGKLSKAWRALTTGQAGYFGKRDDDNHVLLSKLQHSAGNNTQKGSDSARLPGSARALTTFYGYNEAIYVDIRGQSKLLVKS